MGVPWDVPQEAPRGAVGTGQVGSRGHSGAEQRPAADTGERGSCVAGAAMYCSPARLRPGVRRPEREGTSYGGCGIRASINLLESLNN